MPTKKIEPSIAYKQLIVLIARATGISETDIWPDEHLVGDVFHTSDLLRAFVPRLNTSFQDYNLNLSRPAVLKCDLISDLWKLILVSINGDNTIV